MAQKITSIQFFLDDAEKVRILAGLLGEEMGSKVSRRVAVMIAVNKLIKEKTNGNKGG